MSSDPKFGGYARITLEGWAVAKARTGALSPRDAFSARAIEHLLSFCPEAFKAS
jgi:hypothetical protein